MCIRDRSTAAGVDLFPLTDPSMFSQLVAGYRGDRYFSHFGERFIALIQDVMSAERAAQRGP